MKARVVRRWIEKKSLLYPWRSCISTFSWRSTLRCVGPCIGRYYWAIRTLLRVCHPNMTWFCTELGTALRENKTYPCVNMPPLIRCPDLTCFRQSFDFGFVSLLAVPCGSRTCIPAVRVCLPRGRQALPGTILAWFSELWNGHYCHLIGQVSL